MPKSLSQEFTHEAVRASLAPKKSSFWSRICCCSSHEPEKKVEENLSLETIEQKIKQLEEKRDGLTRGRQGLVEKHQAGNIRMGYFVADYRTYQDQVNNLNNQIISLAQRATKLRAKAGTEIGLPPVEEKKPETSKFR